MKRKFRKSGESAEELLRGALELTAWQTELIRAALAKLAQAEDKPVKGRKRPDPPPPAGK